MSTTTRARFDGMVRHFLYPILALLTLGYLAYELAGPPGAIGRHYGVYLAVLVVVMILIEIAHPLLPEWSMTRATLWRRDVPFLILGASTLAAANHVAAMVVTRHAMASGPWLAHVPLVPGVVLSVLITDFLWYWLHRFSHEARGNLGRFLWRVHAAHHLPRQVYVAMHVVGHPVNAIMVRAILVIPPYLMGFSPEVVFVASVVTGFQGLVAHFNVDSRVGCLNYLLVGTELHRFHHSADTAEAKNYGAVVSVWDQLFGTFVYRPGEAPRALGVDQPHEYPADTQLLSVLLHPLRRSTST